MVEVNFDKVENAEDFSPLPDSKYQVNISRVEESTTKKGDPMWRLGMRVVRGEYIGRMIFDNLVFVGGALSRIKLIFSRLGLPSSGKVSLVPEMLIGKQAVVTVFTEQYTDAAGKTKKRNIVSFGGYERVPAESTQEPNLPEDDIPF